MALTKCQTAAAIGVLVSVMVAAGLGATLYVTNRNSDTNFTTPLTTDATVKTTSGEINQTPCGYCGSEINVELRVESNVGDNQFNHTLGLTGRQRELIFFLQQAADTQEEFKFSANYGKYGFFITTLNGLQANYTADKTWWQISDGNDVPLNLGVSSYIPKDEETIIFTFVQSSGH